MANPNRVMAYVAKSASSWTTFAQGEHSTAVRCADYFKERGYKVRVTRFNVGPRNQRGYNWKVTVYYDAATQKTPDAMAWKFAPENQS
jgi:hypothetical protein